MAEAPVNPPPGSSSDPGLTGQILDDYRVLRRLGRGAMADVYLAEQVSLGRQVALKVLKASLADDHTYIRRFRLEAQAAAALAHANIVQIYEVGCIDHHYFIAQEYVAGQNLSHYLDRQGPPDVRHALRILRQVAAALSKAAQHGIVHRDIKPENIMLAQTGEVKVADFGLARVTGDHGNSTLTQVGITMGTPLYMSPEQIEGSSLDPRSDLYSLGVTAYQMLAGKLPFTGETPLSVAVQHLKKSPERLETLRPDLPPGLCRIVHRLLAKDRAQRYRDARELLADLRVVASEVGADDEPETTDTSYWGPDTTSDRGKALAELTAAMRVLPHANRRAGQWRWWWVAIAAAGIAGAAIAWSTSEPNLLAGADPERVHIERRPTVLEQWVLAMQEGSEDAWRSILQYYPQDRYFVLRAKQQLARMYLHDEARTGEALELFDELANLPDAEAELRAFGLAGQAIIYGLEAPPVAAHDQSTRAIAAASERYGPRAAATAHVPLESARTEGGGVDGI